MTILTKIEVRIAQFFTLCLSILVSERWFSWLLKIPAFILLVCGLIITRPYEWIYVWLCKRRYGKASASDIEQKLRGMTCTDQFMNIVDIFR